MTNQEQLTLFQNLIEFLKEHEKLIENLQPQEGGWIDRLRSRFKVFLKIDTGVEVLESTSAFQNEFSDFLDLWIDARVSTDYGTNKNYHVRTTMMTGIYLRHLIRLYTELVEALDNKPRNS